MDRDTGRPARKMVADTQGKIRCEPAVVQRIVEPLDGDLRRGAQTEEGENARCIFGKFDGLAGEDRGDVVPTDEPASGPVGGQMSQCLKLAMV